MDTSSELIELDGRTGEGGGQILRTALGLSVATGRPFRIHDIRGRRRRPGLLRQHLCCVKAAERVGGAYVQGATLGSSELVFEPSGIYPGTLDLAVGSAGSTTLVLQSILPALLIADGSSTVAIEGGTHNMMAPPFPFLDEVFAPVLRLMGASIDLELVRPGFFPAGGGRFAARITGGELSPIELVDAPTDVRISAEAIVSALPRKIATRELNVCKERLGLKRDTARMTSVENPRGPGNVLLLRAEWEGGAELFTGFGRKRVPAEKVAGDAVDELEAWSARGVPVAQHLADQLLIPMALAGGGRFRTGPLSLHTSTNIEVVERFLPVRFTVEELGEGRSEVSVRQL